MAAIGKESGRFPQKRLILGAASAIDHDGVTVDNDPNQKPDVLHDLNDIPWPFEDNQFKEVICHHVIEHLDDIFKIMGELYRVCDSEGTVYIEVPHFSCWQANAPFHKLRFSYFALDGFLEKREAWNRREWIISSAKFSLKRRELTFHRAFRRFQLHRIFNRCPLTYERFWTYLFPAEHLKFWLQPIKKT